LSVVFSLQKPESQLISVDVFAAPKMRVNALLALGAYAALSKADLADEISDSLNEASSSVGSVVESVTSSAVSKPTFTVSLSHDVND